jgi:GNAT superfamily N-acetyltransferase
MPLYEVELEDGSLYEIESDSEPTRDQVQSALSQPQQSKGDQLRSELASLRSGETPTVEGGVGAQASIGLDKILPSIGESAWGALAGASRLSPFNLIPGYSENISEPAGEFFDRQAAEKREALRQLGQVQQQTGGPKIVADVVGTIGSIAPALAVAPAGLPAMVGAAGMQSYGSAYSQAKGMGLSEGQAQTDALIKGAITAAVTRGFGGTGLEAIGSKTGRQSARTLLANILKQGGLEATEEATDEVLQTAYDMAVRQPDMSIEDALYQVMVAGVAGGLFGGGAATVNAASQLLDRGAESTDQQQATQPIQFLPEGEGALQGAPLQPEVSDAIQRQGEAIPGDVQQSQVTQEGQGQVPATEDRPQAAQAQVARQEPEQPLTRDEFFDEVVSGTAAVTTIEGEVVSGADHADARRRAEEMGFDVGTPEQLGQRAGWLRKGKFVSAKNLDSGLAFDRHLRDVSLSRRDAQYSQPQVAPELQEDINRFNELGQRFQQLSSEGNVDSPEFMEVWQERERIKNKYGGMPPTAESVSTDPSQISPTEVGKELTGRQRMEAKLKAAEAREGVTPESIGFQPAPEIGPNIQRLEIPGQGEVRADFSGTGTIKIDFVAVTGERGRGTGSKLVNEVKRVADSQNRPVLLTAHSVEGEQEALNRFYERLGFRRMGTEMQSGKPIYGYTPQSVRASGKETATQFFERTQSEEAVIETEGALAPEQVLGLTFNPPAAGTSGLEKGQAPPGQTFRGPVQERDRTKTSRAKFMNFDAITQTEKERQDFADGLVEESRQNFNAAYNRLRTIDDPSYRAVATAAVLTDMLDRFTKANVADRFIMEGQIDILESDMEGMMAGQFLQSFNQVNRIMAPFKGYLSHVKESRKRLRDSLLNAISVDQDITPEEATERANQLVESAEKQNQAQKTAVSILDKLATSQSDVLKWNRKKANGVRDAMREFMNGDITADQFEARLDELGVTPETSSSLRIAAEREAGIRQLQATVRDIDGQRSRIAKELGANEETAEKLLQLGLKAKMEKSELKRKRILEQMVDVIHNEVDQGKINPSDLLRDVWYGSVLMRIGTFINVLGGAWAAGAGFTLAASTVTTARGKPLLAMRIIGQFIGGVYEGTLMAKKIITEGDYTLLPDYERRAQAILSGKGRKDSLEALWKRGGVSGIFPGALTYTRRIMTALDYIGALGTQDAQLLFSAMTRKDQDSMDALMRRFDKKANQEAERQAKEDLGKDAPRIDILTRKREILEEGVNPEIREAAVHVGRRAAANAPLRGITGGAYNMVRGMPFYARAVTGLAFMRAAMNMVANASDWYPVLGLVTYGRAKLKDVPKKVTVFGKPVQEFGLDLPKEEQHMILAMQALSLGATAALAWAFLGDDDDNEMELSGSWLGLTNSQRKALLEAKEKPNSIRFGKNGQWLSFKQVPFAGPLNIVGNMRDAQRFRGEEWDGDTTLGHITNAWLSGLLFIKDMSTLSGLTRMFGLGATQERFEDLQGQFSRMIAESVGRAASGFIPSIIKEIDQFSDPRLFRPEKDKAMDYWMRTLPLARKQAGVGPELNLFGEEVKLDRSPARAWLGGGTDDPRWQMISRNASQGIFPPVPGRTSTIVGLDGERRQMNAQEFYQYSKLWGDQFKDYVETNLPQMQIADKENAQWYYDDFRDSMSADKTLGRLIRNSVLPTE